MVEKPMKTMQRIGLRYDRSMKPKKGKKEEKRRESNQEKK